MSGPLYDPCYSSFLYFLSCTSTEKNIKCFISSRLVVSQYLTFTMYLQMFMIPCIKGWQINFVCLQPASFYSVRWEKQELYFNWFRWLIRRSFAILCHFFSFSHLVYFQFYMLIMYMYFKPYCLTNWSTILLWSICYFSWRIITHVVNHGEQLWHMWG